MCKNRKGFSLLELLIVVSVVAALGAVGVGFYLNYAKNIEIKTVANTLISDLKQAQSKSMIGAGGFKWGVHLVNGETDYYETFSSPSDYSDASKNIISTVYLSQGVSFSDPTSGSTKDIVFNKITGGTTENLIILSSSDTTKTISISSVGSIINGGVVVSGIPVIKLLVVAGGGGGGTPDGGGGGAGGYIYEPSYAISKQTYTVNVGDGGTSVSGLTKTQGGQGGYSSFDSIMAEGGGGGGYTGGPGGAGGSGGGGGGYDNGIVGVGGSGTQDQGQDGGSALGGSPSYGGGGGGGAVGPGQDGGSAFAGAGGVGFVNPITGSVSGHNVAGVYYFSGGGGGATDSSNGAPEGAAGGYGGGGKGGYGITSRYGGIAGAPNTGGGGGGAPWGQESSGAGGSGVVIISYVTDSGITATGGTKTTVGANTIHTFTTSGIFEVLSIPDEETPAPAPDPVAVGDTYQGGVVAYILQTGDSGYSASVQHGFIAAVNDQSAGIYWHVSSSGETGAMATAIGSGNDNTIAIIGTYGAENNAAKLCSDLNLGSKTDWYLPSKDELNKLYENRAAVGGFSNAEYFSSTEYNSWYAWKQNMVSGGQYQNGDKDSLKYVRCIRSF